MSAKDDLIVYAVVAAVALAGAWYVKKKVGDVAADVAGVFNDAWGAAAQAGAETWYAAAPGIDATVSTVTGVAGVYVPGMSYPDYLGAANVRRDAMAAGYGPQIVGGRVSTSNPINDAFNSAYQSIFGPGRTLGSDIYDWSH